MKAKIYDMEGNEKGTVELPAWFEDDIRPDIAAKYFEADKLGHPYGPDPKAGRKHSASGTISHKRHDWKAHYGRGIARLPRKTMWRRGVQFFWIGATAPGTRGGRRAHPPKGIGKENKINKKEVEKAMRSGFASTARKDLVVDRYESLDKVDFELPIVLESGNMQTKTKDFHSTLKKIFGKAFSLVLQEKKIRAGKGTKRGRRFKKNAGLLLITGHDEPIKVSGIETKPVNEVRIRDLYPLGRLTAYTKKAIEELKKAKAPEVTA